MLGTRARGMCSWEYIHFFDIVIQPVFLCFNEVDYQVQ